MGERLLTDKMSLEEACVYANNSDAPLTLITQTHTEITEETQPIQRGFRDTALAT